MKIQWVLCISSLFDRNTENKEEAERSESEIECMRCGGGCWTTAESSKYFFSILLRIHRINYIFRAFSLRGECKGIIQPLIFYLTPAQLSFPWYKRGVSISNVHSHKNAHNCVECSRRIDHMCECRMVEDVKWFYSHLEIKRRATIFFRFSGRNRRENESEIESERKPNNRGWISSEKAISLAVIQIFGMPNQLQPASYIDDGIIVVVFRFPFLPIALSLTLSLFIRLWLSIYSAHCILGKNFSRTSYSISFISHSYVISGMPKYDWSHIEIQIYISHTFVSLEMKFLLPKILFPKPEMH